MDKAVFFGGVIALVAPSAAMAHDFWLEPAKFTVAEREQIAVNFTIGHAGEHEPWNLQLEKVVELKSCAAARCIAQTDIAPNTKAARGRALVTFRTAGTQVLAFESKKSFSELDGGRFTEYATKEGLAAILDDRAARDAADEPGRELYSRRAKALVRVGDGDPGDVSAAVGHTLEIVPLKNPYALSPGEALPVRVLYNGAPLAGATIDFDDLADKLDPLQGAKTDGDGVAAFRIEGSGPFKLMTIWGEPLQDRREADFETIFASLTFGR